MPKSYPCCLFRQQFFYPVCPFDDDDAGRIGHDLLETEVCERVCGVDPICINMVHVFEAGVPQGRAPENNEGGARRACTEPETRKEPLREGCLAAPEVARERNDRGVPAGP